MAKYFCVTALILSASSAQAACVFDSSTMGVRGKNCPKDVASFVERSNACTHFAGEPYDAGDEAGRQRKEFLLQKMGELKCDALDKEGLAIKRKYKARPQILRFIKDYSDILADP